jgi:threonine efflux protein
MGRDHSGPYQIMTPLRKSLTAPIERNQVKFSMRCMYTNMRGFQKRFLSFSPYSSMKGCIMSYLPQLLALAGVWAIVVISPGPNFVATVHHAVSYSRRDGLLVVLGIAAGTTIWATVSVVGLGVLFAHVSWLVEVIRTIGAIYLTYLGGKMIWQAARQKVVAEPSAVAPRRGPAWRVGFLTDISNPKAAAFFGSLFSVFLPAYAPLWLQVASVVVVVLIAACWYSVVACFFSLEPVARGYRRVKKWIDYVTGGVLVALGVRLAVSK